MTQPPESDDTHVLLVPSWYPSEQAPLSGTFFREQAEALRHIGLRVGVIAPRVMGVGAWLRGGRPSLGIARAEENGVQVYRRTTVPAVPRFSRRNAWFWMRAGAALFDAYVRDHGRPDLIHAHSTFCGGMLARRLGGRHDIRYAVTEHHTAFARGRLRRWQRRRAAEVFAAAAARIAVSPQLGAVLTAQFGDAFCPWRYVPNMLDERFEAAEDRPPRPDDGRFTYLTVAQFHPKKAHHVLIRAFATAARADRRLHLRLAGTGGELPRCRALARDLGVADRVAFPGDLSRADVRREMLAADAFVLPSYCETFGVVVIEALASGLPVIATRCGGPECIVHPQNGVIVPPGDVAALSRALVEMRRDAGRYDPDALRRDCVERFGRTVVARQLAEVYGSILTRGQGPDHAAPAAADGEP